jgi:hypothetical protein
MTLAENPDSALGLFSDEQRCLAVHALLYFLL